MRMITRTVETHVITSAMVGVVEGQVTTTELEKIIINNQTINDEKALKLVQKKFGKGNQYVILSIETSSKVLGIEYDLFLKHAKEIR